MRLWIVVNIDLIIDENKWSEGRRNYLTLKSDFIRSIKTTFRLEKVRKRQVLNHRR